MSIQRDNNFSAVKGCSYSERGLRRLRFYCFASLLTGFCADTLAAQSLVCPLALAGPLTVPSSLTCPLNTITTLTDQLANGAILTPLQLNNLSLATQSLVVTPFVVRRNDMLLSSDLGLDRQFDIIGAAVGTDIGWPKPSGLGGPRAPSANGREPATRTAPGNGIAVWAEGAFNFFEDGGNNLESDGQAGVLYLGADHRLTRGVLLGALVQFDNADQKLDVVGSRVSDTGWMVGPYAAVRLTDNLFLQARAAWGQSENTVTLSNVYKDSFDADRWLVRSTLVGQWTSGAWQFRPHISVGFIDEHQNGHVGQFGPVSPADTSLGQAKLGPEIGYQYWAAGGTLIEPRLMIEGIWNFAQSGDDIFVDDLVSGDETRARAEAGLLVRARDGLAAAVSVDYDGIGSGDYRSVGGKLRLMVPLN
jgi:hypothetical protein